MLEKARVVFQPGNPPTILASRNVVDITQVQPGSYQVNLTERLPRPDNGNVCTLAAIGGFTGIAADRLHIGVQAHNTGPSGEPAIVPVLVFDDTGTLTDSFSEVSVVVMADTVATPAE